MKYYIFHLHISRSSSDCASESARLIIISPDALEDV
jgi:hypothetical protein